MFLVMSSTALPMIKMSMPSLMSHDQFDLLSQIATVAPCQLRSETFVGNENYSLNSCKTSIYAAVEFGFGHHLH
jgi:hypothetical protein